MPVNLAFIDHSIAKQNLSIQEVNKIGKQLSIDNSILRKPQSLLNFDQKSGTFKASTAQLDSNFSVSSMEDKMHNNRYLKDVPPDLLTFRASTINDGYNGGGTFRASTINNDDEGGSCFRTSSINNCGTFRASTIHDAQASSRNINSTLNFPSQTTKSFIKFGSIKSPVDIIKAYQKSHTIAAKEQEKMILPPKLDRLSSVSSIDTDKLQDIEENFEGGEEQSTSSRQQSSSKSPRSRKPKQFSPIMLCKSNSRSKTLKPRQIEILISSAESPEKEKEEKKSLPKRIQTKQDLLLTKANETQVDQQVDDLDESSVLKNPQLLAKIRIKDQIAKEKAMSVYYRSLFGGLKLSQSRNMV